MLFALAKEIDALNANSLKIYAFIRAANKKTWGR